MALLRTVLFAMFGIVWCFRLSSRVTEALKKTSLFDFPALKLNLENNQSGMSDSYLNWVFTRADPYK